MSDLMKVSSNPHIRSKDSTSRIMLAVIIALLPTTIFGIYNFGIKALLIVAITVASTVLTEFIYEKLTKKKNTIGDLSAVVTGLLLVKMLFGGLGQNFMNPALGARCFLLISFASIMTNFNCDAYTGATPLAAVKAGENVNVLDMVIGRTAGTIGETSMLCIVLGACLLIWLEIIDLRIPGTYIVSFVIFMVLFGGHGPDRYYISSQLAGGGLMLGAFFMATDYVTRPVTKKGQYIYGIFLGILTGRVFPMPSFWGTCWCLLLRGLLFPKLLVKEESGHEKYAEGCRDFITDYVDFRSFSGPCVPGDEGTDSHTGRKGQDGGP